jgi:hypothetical protein
MFRSAANTSDVRGIERSRNLSPNFASHLPNPNSEPVALAIVCDSQNDCGAAVAGHVPEVRDGSRQSEQLWTDATLPRMT